MERQRIIELVKEMDKSVEPVYHRMRAVIAKFGSIEDADKNFVAARYHIIHSEYSVALEYLELAHNTYRIRREFVAQGFVHVFASICFRELRIVDDAVEKIRTALRVAQEADEPFLLMYALPHAIIQSSMFGDEDECDRLITWAKELLPSCDSKFLEGNLHQAFAFVCDTRKRYSCVLEHCLKSYELYSQCYDGEVSRNQLISAVNIAEAQNQLGQYEEAVETIARVENEAKTGGYTQIRLYALELLADNYFRRERYEDAFEARKRYMELFEVWMEERLKVPEDENEDLKFRLEITQDNVMMKNGELIEKKRVLEHLLSSQQIVQQVGSKLTSAGEIEDIFNLVCDAALKLFKYDAISVALIEGDDIVVRYMHHYDRREEEELPIYISKDSKAHMMSYCLRNNVDVMVNSLEEYATYVESDILELDRQYQGIYNQSSMYIRLIHEGKIFGLITVQKLEKHAYTAAEFDSIKGLASFVSIAINNAVQNKQIEEKAKALEVISLRDELTWLENRRSYNFYVDELVASDREYILIFADMNHLKEINDGLGHSSGDRYLAAISDLFRSVAQNHRKFRLSGDEFAIIVEHPSIQQVYELLRAIKRDCAKIKIGKYPLALAIGCAYRKSGDNPDRVFTVAEARMYLDKYDYHWRYGQLALSEL